MSCLSNLFEHLVFVLAPFHSDGELQVRQSEQLPIPLGASSCMNDIESQYEGPYTEQALAIPP